MNSIRDETKNTPKEGCEVGTKPIVDMPIKAHPYQHQIRAYNFALKLFGMGDGDDKNNS